MWIFGNSKECTNIPLLVGVYSAATDWIAFKSVGLICELAGLARDWQSEAWAPTNRRSRCQRCSSSVEAEDGGVAEFDLNQEARGEGGEGGLGGEFDGGCIDAAFLYLARPSWLVSQRSPCDA